MQLLVDVSSLANIRQGLNLLAYLEAGAVAAENAQVEVQQQAPAPQPQPELPANVTQMPQAQPAPAPQPDPQTPASQQDAAALRQRINDAAAQLGHRMEEIGAIISSFGVEKVSELTPEQMSQVAATVEGMVADG
tara:strand:+ start:1633 stop:2037 length:405 start_codon:yes stop_codon:yes gene_type:complete